MKTPWEIAYEVADIIHIQDLLEWPEGTSFWLREGLADYFEKLHNSTVSWHEDCERDFPGTCVQAQPFDRVEFLRRAAKG